MNTKLVVSILLLVGSLLIATTVHAQTETSISTTGEIESETGFRFPDGSLQTTKAQDELYYLDCQDGQATVYDAANLKWICADPLQGPQGDPGTDGADGAPGTPGAAGVDGEDGADGANCYDGIGTTTADCIGAKGDKGDAGEPGVGFTTDCQTDEIAKWDGSAWVCATDPMTAMVKDAICALYANASLNPRPDFCPPVTVFVTSTAYTGDLGGLAGGDAKCQERADAAALPGIWVAWLSAGGINAIDRIADTVYTKVDGTVIANDKDDLTDGILQTPIDRDEFGALRVYRVWTGTELQGSQTANNCSDWSTGLEEVEGRVGWSGDIDYKWTSWSDSSCANNTHRLYCFVGRPPAPTTYAIGDTGPAGGFVFHITDGGLHGLEAAREDQSAGVQWGCIGKGNGASGTAVGTGMQNTLAILQPAPAGCDTRPIAASVAAEYMGPNGDTDDWFLPSKGELNLMYDNIGNGNVDNPNVGEFDTTNSYWTSSETGGLNAWSQEFLTGNQGYGYYSKQDYRRVRAVRAF